MTVGSILLILTLTGLYCFYGNDDNEQKTNTEERKEK